eukprot:1126042_1
MATAHQKYIRHKTGIKTLKELLHKSIQTPMKFYDHCVYAISDKDHSIKGIRNAMNNSPLWYPLQQAWKYDRDAKPPILETHENTFHLDRYSKMNMKFIFDLFSRKTILALKNIERRACKKTWIRAVHKECAF